MSQESFENMNRGYFVGQELKFRVGCYEQLHGPYTHGSTVALDMNWKRRGVTSKEKILVRRKWRACEEI